MYYIKQLSVFTKNHIKSEINLKYGLNIIHGESNTGKSLIVDCINYMYGAKDHRFDHKLNIEKIQMIISVNGKEIELTRYIDSKKIEVLSNYTPIKSNTYPIQKSGSIWLNLMGINEEVSIVKASNGSGQSLTFRTFCRLFLIDEVRVISTNSLLSSKVPSNSEIDIPTLSALIFLATGNNFSANKNLKNKKTRNERTDAVQTFVDRSIDRLKTKNTDELSNIYQYTPKELELMISSTIADIASTEGILEENNKKCNELSNLILNVENEIYENKLIFNRNSSLASQYSSDIERLIFIAEGDFHSKDFQILDRCPFCNGILTKEQHESCIKAAIDELENIQSQIKDLESLQESIKLDLEELSEKKKQLIEERKKIEITINRTLLPKIENLNNLLRDYTLTLNRYKAKEMIDNFTDILINELNITKYEESETAKIDIKQKFNDTFANKLNTEVEKLLKACNYQNYLSSRFDRKDFDIIVNNHIKKSQGKGFRAYLNTIMSIAIRNCLQEYNLYVPEVLVIDSPILSLKEKDDKEQISETMKVGLFNYLLEHQSNGQVIIIENEIPDINYKNANMITFTKDVNKGRYGLIKGYRG